MRSEFSRKVVQELSLLYRCRTKISVRIESSWGTERGHQYLKKLLVKDRSNRQGFDVNSYMMLMHLYLLHVEEYGDFNSPLVIRNNSNIKLI